MKKNISTHNTSKHVLSIIGIDEVGRGPLAGPVTIGVFVVYQKYWKQFSAACKTAGVTDSKKLSPQKREALVALLDTLCAKGWCTYLCMSSSAQMIDTQGIAPVIRGMIARSLKKCAVDPARTTVVLDGSLSAPALFTNQQTIIKGDSVHVAISAASLVAKVARDAYMVRQAIRYPQYGFEVHKGYGTAMHRKAIATYGFCPLHRRTFCRGIIPRNSVKD